MLTSGHISRPEKQHIPESLPLRKNQIESSPTEILTTYPPLNALPVGLASLNVRANNAARRTFQAFCHWLHIKLKTGKCD
jgi:hypothetical protein